MKNKKGRYSWAQRLGAFALAVLMVAGILPARVFAAEEEKAVGQVTTVADPDTVSRPVDTYGDNTQNAGKITVGKSVSDAAVTLPSGTGSQTFTPKDDQFIITVSQAAQVMGLASESKVPVDVVFVLDTSGSMDGGRSASMVTAANSAIKTLMEANPNNRIGVVAFSGKSYSEAAAEQLSALAHYNDSGNTLAASQHLRWSGSNILGRGSNAGSRNGNSGGTNIHAGIALGAQMLTGAGTTVEIDGKTVTRMPFLVVLSDGAPTYSSSSTNWYKLSLKFFYLERGGNVSYCRLRFNIPTLPDKSLTVTKELSAEVATADAGQQIIEESGDYRFRVVHADNTDAPYFKAGTSYNVLQNGVVVDTRTLDAAGIFVLKAGQSAQFEDVIANSNGGESYLVQELIPTAVVGQYDAVYFSIGGIGGTEVSGTVSGDDTVYSTGSMLADQTHSVVFHNDLNLDQLGSMTITKVLTRQARKTMADRVFQMEVTLNGMLLPVGTVYTVDGETKTVQQAGVIDLMDGQTATIHGIVSGASYLVTERIVADSFEPTFSGTVSTGGTIRFADDRAYGMIPQKGLAAITVTNDVPNTSLSVDKTVEATEDPNSFILTLNAFAKSGTSDITNALNGSTVLREVLSDYVQLDENAEVKVKVYTQPYLGNGNWGELDEFTPAEGMVLKTSPASGRVDTIEVSGFDYRAEYVAETPRAKTEGGTEDYRGSKLVVKVYIETRDGFWGGNNVPTNNTADSTTGIYNGDTLVEPFPEPEINVPIAVDVKTKDKTIYYGNDVTPGDLIDSITVGGSPVVMDGDKLFPEEDWMDDFVDVSWSEDSVKPTDDASSTQPKDYAFGVTVLPKYDGSGNRSDNPSNIDGNINGGETGDVIAETPKTDSDTGHVYILTPTVTFKDSIIDFAVTPDGNYYSANDYVDTTWSNMENDLPEGTVVPEASGTAPELTFGYEAMRH